MAAFLVLAGGRALADDKDDDDTAHLQPYGGWASTKGAVVLGRAVKGDPASGRAHHHTVTRLGSTAKAFLRRDLENAKLRVTELASGRSVDARSDDEGFFDVRFPGPLPVGAATLRVELVGSKRRAPPLDLRFDVVDADAPGLLVVSDLDDTLTATGVTGGKASLVWGTATRGAADMTAYPLAAAVLRALAETGAPVVYLTASPIELAPRISAFLTAAGFPAGPVLLRYYRRDGVKDPAGYKRARVSRLLADFPARRLILLGDNGEQDPELFRALAAETGRVAASYVRATLPGQASDARYQGHLLFSHFREVVRDLARRGFIRWWRAQRIYLSEDR